MTDSQPPTEVTAQHLYEEMHEELEQSRAMLADGRALQATPHALTGILAGLASVIEMQRADDSYHEWFQAERDKNQRALVQVVNILSLVEIKDPFVRERLEKVRAMLEEES